MAKYGESIDSVIWDLLRNSTSGKIEEENQKKEIDVTEECKSDIFWI